MDVTASAPVVYTAHSKMNFFCRDVICEFVLKQGYVPLNPFRVFDYFLNDRVDRDLVRRGNNNIVRIADEIWVFGPISNGVLFEVKYATQLGTRIRYFTISTNASDIVDAQPEHIKFEEELLASGEYDESCLRKIIIDSLVLSDDSGAKTALVG